MPPIQICRGFTDEQWKGLRSSLIDKTGVVQENEKAWECAVQVLHRRITERFLSCIKKLDEIGAPWEPVPPGAPSDCSRLPVDDGAVVAGFVIMGLCCLLIETLQTFRLGKIVCAYPNGECAQRETATFKKFWNFLKRDGSAFGETFKKRPLAYQFYDGVRCGILHQAETRGWVIRRTTEANQIVSIDGDAYVLDRSLFWKALNEEFKTYKDELLKGQDIRLRKSFVETIDHIVNECRAGL
jgi:hypothetical protein